MRIAKASFLLLLLHTRILNTCFAAATPPAALAPLFQPSVKVYRHIAQVDPQVRRELLRQFRDDARLADSGAAFSAGCDFGPGSPPSRRLVLAAYAAGRWFIQYEHGGVGLHAHLFVFEPAGRRWRISYRGVGFYDHSTLTSLRNAIRNKKEFHQPGVDA
jgi:hypothetical protein